MFSNFDGPVELMPIRSRHSTAGSTGLEYATCPRVDEDIISGARSLFLLHDDHRPQLAPHLSNEHRDSIDIVPGFDFSTAKSIARQAHLETQRFSVPKGRRTMPSSAWEMEPLPALNLPTPYLRAFSSAYDLKAHSARLWEDTPNESKKFQFPKLILGDKKKRDQELRSCIEISRRVPSNDAQIHGAELDCCPPCDPVDPQPSKYIANDPNLPGPQLKIEPADLACFLAGCPPGQANCREHLRRRRSVAYRKSIFHDCPMPDDSRKIGEGLKRDVVRLGLSIQCVPIKSPQIVKDTDEPLERNLEDKPRQSGRFIVTEDKEKRSSHKNTRSHLPPISPTSSVTSGSTDAFPLAAHYMQLAATESQSRFSTAATTNFCLPDDKDTGKPKRASVILRNKLSDSSVQFKQRASSSTPGPHQIGSVRMSRAPPRAMPPETKREKSRAPNRRLSNQSASTPPTSSIGTRVFRCESFRSSATRKANSSDSTLASPTALLVAVTPTAQGKKSPRINTTLLKVAGAASLTAEASVSDAGSNQADMPGQLPWKKPFIKGIKELGLASPTEEAPAADTEVNKADANGQLASKESSIESTKTTPKPPASQVINSRASETSLSFTKPTASESIRNKASEASLKSKFYTPSLFSGASRTSAARHALLKPSVTESQPVDTGLPVPPILSPVPVEGVGSKSIAELNTEEIKSGDINALNGADIGSRDPSILRIDQEEEKLEIRGSVQPEGEKVKPEDEPAVRSDHEALTWAIRKAPKQNISTSAIDHLTSLQRAKELVDSMRGQVQQVEEQMLNAVVEESDRAAADQQRGDPCGVGATKKPSSANKATKSAAISPKSHALMDCQLLTEEKEDLFKISPPMIDPPAQDPSKLGMRKRDSPAALQPVTAIANEIHTSAQDPSKLDVTWKEPLSPQQIVDPGAGDAVPPADSLNAAYWGFVPTTPRDSETTSIFASRPSRVDLRPTALVWKPSADPLGQRTPPDGAHGYDSRPSSAASKNQENEATPTFDDAAESATTPGRTSPGELETVPLESDVKFEADGQVPGWRLVEAFKKGYTPIPTRKSSRNRVLSPKTSATNSVSNLSPKGTVSTPARKRSYERLVSRANRDLRSISSAGSLRSTGSANNDQDAEKLLPAERHALPKDDPREDPKATASVLSSRKLSGKNTVHWLRELLSSNDPYQVRFTNLPPRTRKDYEALNKPSRSFTAPVTPVSESFLGKTPVPPVPKPTVPKSRQTKKIDPSEAFSKTINDLENLMNEALLIARHAADSQDPVYAPKLLGSAVEVLKDGRKRDIDAELKPFLERERMQSKISALRCSERSSVPSMHESLLSYFGSSDSEFEDNEATDSHPLAQRSIRISSIKIPSKHASGWPPTGRVSTPFPPASTAPSQDSADSPPLAEQEPSVVGDQMRTVGSKTLPTETGVDNTNQNIASHKQSKGTSVLERFIPKKPSLFTPRDPKVISSSERSPSLLQPEFRTLQPFNGFGAQKLEESCKSPVKPPSRLRPARKSRVAEVDSNHMITASENVVVDLIEEPTFQRDSTRNLPQLMSQSVSLSQNDRDGHSQEEQQAIASKLASQSVPNKRDVRGYVVKRNHPPIAPRLSSLGLRKLAEQQQANYTAKHGKTGASGQTQSWQDIGHNEKQSSSLHPETRGKTSGHDLVQRFMDQERPRYSHSLDGSIPEADHGEVLDFEVGYGAKQRSGGEASRSNPPQAIELQDMPDPNLPQISKSVRETKKNMFSLSNKRHLSLREHHLKGFSFTRSHKRQAIARDWSSGRKRFVATVSCISTALIGILVGIYAGETPAIQYYIVDFHHYTVLGNVFFFTGLAVPTFLFWPLPLLHGRKPYILGSMSLAMPLLFPQALAVGQFRSPYVATWRIGLILPRALMGFCLGFANMNFKAMLTDLFGASLQSQNPHQEHVDEFDVRRHGGGMGSWLGLWTWCSVGSIGFGFMIGAVIINTLSPAWGFYVSIAIIAFVMLLNVLCPEVRRSAFRRSVAEVVKEKAVSRRLARGEVKMHMVQSGPKWWGEEFHYGVILSKKMLRQPGFLVMVLYNAWIYGQMVLIISLLGALMSKDYKFTSPAVGASVTSLPLGALLAIPFQKASFFSRARIMVVTSDDATLKKKFSWSSHMLRRSIFMLFLPFGGLAYTLTSSGPPIPFILPIIFAAVISFLSSLALAECSGIIMETFDTSDLQPGMSGRPRGSAGDKSASKRTNYSSFPRVQSAFALCQGFGYLVAAGASGVGGVLTRHLGQQAATGVMAGILLILSLLLLAVLIRFTDVQIIPDSKKGEMERYHQARRASVIRHEEGIEEEEEPWRPFIIGNPHHITRRMCLLELGSMSRFSEIRRKNKLVDEKSLEAKHPNLAAMEDVKQYVQVKEAEFRNNVRQSLSRHGSRESRRSKTSDAPEQGDLGGHREILSRAGSSKGSRRGGPITRKGTSLARKGIEEQEKE